MRLLHGHLGLLTPLNQWAGKRVTVLAGRIEANYQGKTGLLQFNKSKEDQVWNPVESVRYLLITLPRQ